jgi:hypothetical protein
VSLVEESFRLLEDDRADTLLASRDSRGLTQAPQQIDVHDVLPEPFLEPMTCPGRCPIERG